MVVLGGMALMLALVVALWWRQDPDLALTPRVPGADGGDPSGAGMGGANPVLRGELRTEMEHPRSASGMWPQFRGMDRDGIARGEPGLLREWPGGKPRSLWSVELGEGYAGAAIRFGCVYVMDYDQEAKRDSLRCLALDTGAEVWRFSYPVSVKRNHGMSRTVPTVTTNRVVAMGPKCHVVCLDALTGELRWGLDLVREFKAKVPPWYTGQCPLVVDGQVILAPGGPDALLMAVDLDSGEVRWQTPNPRGWKMTHSSVVPLEIRGRRQYVYCASGGVVGVAADDGSLLWETDVWKISIAMVPSPVPVGDDRLFLSGGYNAGCLMLQLAQVEDRLEPQVLWRLGPDEFGSTQQTPVFHQNHLFGVRPDGEFVCLDLAGQVVWRSGADQVFGLGPYTFADGLVFVMDDVGHLTLAEVSPSGFRPLAHARVLNGRESWGPMALVDGHLVVRDLSQMVCLEVGIPHGGT